MNDLRIISDVSKFDGAIFSKWYAHAQIEGGRYIEGPLRFLKLRAKADISGLVKRLKRLPYTDSVPRFYQ